MALLMFLLLTGQSQRDIDLNIPAAHPAEAFETIAAMRIASNSLALVIDADGVVWNMATDGDDDWREQTALQADAVWRPSWVSFLLDEDGVLLSSGGTLGDPCGVDTGSEQTGYVRAGRPCWKTSWLLILSAVPRRLCRPTGPYGPGGSCMGRCLTRLFA